ncbi:hypothetical protein EJ04DRAFT_164779 [Polyplosphaeria fusca]|uniref:Uncharacterized protein n=1 Tax=Polyplosphaeria fusca TaxID=682080 RepID=A0A9P4V8X4_9PLEO|nr:hypothetical protein EJ04DRAFT_164779 [Polyplosphaeria fusca]
MPAITEEQPLLANSQNSSTILDAEQEPRHINTSAQRPTQYDHSTERRDTVTEVTDRLHHNSQPPKSAKEPKAWSDLLKKAFNPLGWYSIVKSGCEELWESFRESASELWHDQGDQPGLHPVRVFAQAVIASTMVPVLLMIFLFVIWMDRPGPVPKVFQVQDLDGSLELTRRLE